MKINPYLRILLLILTGVTMSEQVSAQVISFSPSRIFFKGNPGETVSEIVTISNSSTEVYEFVTNLQDWKRDSLGIKMYAPMGKLASSNAKDVSLSSTNFKLNPGEKKSITVSIKIPVNQAGPNLSSNSMLFFTQTNAKAPDMEGKSGIGVKVNLELGVQLFYTPSGAKSGELNFLAFEYENKVIQQQQIERLAVKFENTGEINKDGFVRFELTNKETGEEIKLKPVPIAIMPVSFQWVYCPITTSIPAGNYLAVAILDTGGKNNLKVAEKDIHVKR